MKIQQAIEKAIAGGWMNKVTTEYGYSDTRWQIITSDPLFWQSLGKAMGWTGKAFYEDGMTLKTWKREWHRFIDKLSDGGTAEQFFEELKG
jgi:hypothetical protein